MRIAECPSKTRLFSLLLKYKRKYFFGTVVLKIQYKIIRFIFKYYLDSFDSIFISEFNHVIILNPYIINILKKCDATAYLYLKYNLLKFESHFFQNFLLYIFIKLLQC